MKSEEMEGYGFTEIAKRNLGAYLDADVEARIVNRFALGHEQHERDLWFTYLSCSEKELRDFLRDRVKHFEAHFSRALHAPMNAEDEDDHLAAMVWFCLVAMYIEEKSGDALYKLLDYSGSK